MNQAAQKLRTLMGQQRTIHFPCCFDALSAKLVRQAGFPLSFMSGAAVAAVQLGAPDVGLITMTEMVEQLRRICDATPGYPILADGDTGYGGPLSVQRTVAMYAQAGAAGVMIEDQLDPKRCGHLEGKAVVSRAQAKARISAAVEMAREHDVLLIARTDARAVNGLDDALARCLDFAEAGADVVFMEAPESVEELTEFVRRMPVATLANMVPNGKTPMLSRQRLEDIGVKLVGYHPLLFVTIGAMQSALQSMRTESEPSALPVSFNDLKQVLGLPECEATSARFNPRSDFREHKESSWQKDIG